MTSEVRVYRSWGWKFPKQAFKSEVVLWIVVIQDMHVHVICIVVYVFMHGVREHIFVCACTVCLWRVCVGTLFSNVCLIPPTTQRNESHMRTDCLI